MKIYIASVLLLPAVAGFQLAPTRVTRAVHPLNAADASYAEAIEQDRVTLRRAAATKNEESDAVVDALLGLEQSCKERSRAEGASAGAAIADKLTGAWRLVFTTGTISRQKRTGARVNYFPVKAVQTFDLPAQNYEWDLLRRLGGRALLRPMEFNEESRKLTFDFTRIEPLRGCSVSTPREAPRRSRRDGIGARRTTKLAEQAQRSSTGSIMTTSSHDGQQARRWLKPGRDGAPAVQACRGQFAGGLVLDVKHPGTTCVLSREPYHPPYHMVPNLTRFHEKGG